MDFLRVKVTRLLSEELQGERQFESLLRQAPIVAFQAAHTSMLSLSVFQEVILCTRATKSSNVTENRVRQRD